MTHNASQPDKVTVALGDRRGYDIVIGQGMLRNAGTYIKPVLAMDRVIIVADEHILDAGHLSELQTALDEVFVTYETVVLPAGEQAKSFGQLEKLLEELLSYKPERNMTLIALGGGVIGDITGFAASILLRGVNFIQIPTTLLAMVDSSVGGKNGINTKHGKNLVGSFYQPKLVLADVEMLDTLPKREVLAGYAEVVKYGLIDSPEFFVTLEKKVKEPKDICQSDIIATCCQAKAAIVAEDEKEAGKRALLNLGHTFGHALEAEMGYDGRLLHGEAVAVGMVMAFQFSQRLGLCSPEGVARVKAHLQVAGLTVIPQDISNDFKAERLLEHMRQDKKVEDGKLTFILVEGIGKAFIQKEVEESAVLEFLQDILDG